MPDYLKLPTTTKGLVRVVIETPRGAAAKVAYEPAIQVFGYVRPLPVGMTYPYDWGFIPSTLGDDGDPLDGLVIHQAATGPGTVIKCNLLGALRVKQKDQGGEALRNDRYVFCPHKEDAEDEPVAADRVPEHLRREIEQFFLSSVLGTGKTIKFKGWQDAGEARRAIKKGMKAFAARLRK
ncbi:MULTISPECIES: inorganic diphosphatase [unclassified Mesorhizobium]|uniref:inorganic diphosphatase n=1 Tax=unclassified Mesorhizobium TaxID=325217 RepID=UPI000FE7369E|nr:MULTISPECIES: inorganic diphosphatase [unclassified Mesorhizobium]RWC88912.1 MAG: inorganic diphosphatase [Mesorhizobium sp.]TGT91329.1 inorganic diphosphatase [Mesorhizobium sp. M8A.F.Ca.ET.161.01.1.1]TGV43393.1 inorganic diphosphatase [Mesorhizobium sp. M8A.F.Ca.ET.142.01.1.1]TIT67340.1 MAG: inorganic diphosphatase [Mesorhizobium sp.]